ncbi:acylphosphatase [Arthrobacter jiangjiafuii]|uniref:acylphosphatase n=1 Tax=Arthrobacter jiangjiafuii TaxID=2817475 RepID=A0A975R1X8_9MICC|nr:acylphosphatase [Arthrobacter jiangjiafuii]MBP3044023.1 acylphosphatase [Arthrobacter jiangjiafuii]QWC11013.1 acylphosphatase [Arthrobacter jiangjiafuii]
MTPSDSAGPAAHPPLPGRRLTARITGEVQAVGFRYRTLQQANRLGLTGVVSNSSDGSVHVVAEGGPAEIAGLLQWLRSPAAPGTVTGVEESLSAATGEFPDFRTD